MNLVKKWISGITQFRNLKQYRNSNTYSLFLVRLIEKLPLRTVLSAQLAGLTFLMAIVAPQSALAYSSHQLQYKHLDFIDAPTSTETTFQWPLTRFAISQKFSGYHPGIDLSAPRGTAIHPVADGKVVTAGRKIWEDYGNHIVIAHANGTESLYAHLSLIFVKVGQDVTKDTQIGDVGATGRATGNHLHLEIHQGGGAINPLDVLPALPVSPPVQTLNDK